MGRARQSSPSKRTVEVLTRSSFQVLDEVNAAYYRIYGERVGLTAEEYRRLNRNDPRQYYLYEEGKKGISKSISLAEPTGS